MPTIGKLNYKLIATTGQFQRAMRGAGKTIATLGEKVKSSVGRLVNFKTVIGALLGGGALGLLVKRTLDEVDALAKAADNIGTTTQALRGLQLRANLAGVETEKLTKGLKRYLINIGDAVDGTGEAGEVLEAMGLNAAKIARLPLVESVAAFTDALETLGTTAERANAMSKLFGRTGADLAVFFRDGSKGIREAAAMAEQFGTAITRIDAAKIEQANDAFRLLREVIAGTRFAITKALAPALTELFTGLTKMGNLGLNIEHIFRTALFTVGVSLGRVIDLFKQMQLFIINAQFDFVELQRKARAFLGLDTSEMENTLDDLVKQWEDLANEIHESGSAAERFGDEMVAAYERAEKKASELADSLVFNFKEPVAMAEKLADAQKAARTTGTIGSRAALRMSPTAAGGVFGAQRIGEKTNKLLEDIKTLGQTLVNEGGLGAAP